MANRVLSLTCRLATHIRNAVTSSSSQITSCILQRNSPPALPSSLSLSTLPSATFFSSRLLAAKSEPSKSAGSLYTCGSQIHKSVVVTGFTPGTLQIRCYQNSLRPRLICPGCYLVWRHGRKFVECSDHPRHKQMKTVATRKVWQEDYSKGHIIRAADWHRKFPREFVRLADKTICSHNWLAGKLGKEV